MTPLVALLALIGLAFLALAGVVPDRGPFWCHLAALLLFVAGAIVLVVGGGVTT
jgi:hypothetical protein